MSPRRMDIDRRDQLKLLGLLGGVGVAGALSVSAFDPGRGGDTEPQPTTDQPTPSSTQTDTPTETRTETSVKPDVPHADQFETVIHAGQEGFEPDTGQSITGFLRTYAGHDTLLSLPAGRYELDPLELSGYRHLGIAAAEEEPPRLVGADGHCRGGGDAFLRFDQAEDLLLDNLDFDFEGEGTGGVIRITATGDVELTDITGSGGCDEQVAFFRTDVLDPEATAVIEGLAIENLNDETALTGIFIGKDHAGEVIFRDCTVRGFTDNGLYASPPGLPDGNGGTVRVEQGTYRNNNIANVRLGSRGSVAREVTSISDAPPPTDESSPPPNARGIRLRNGQDELIEDCLVRITADSRFTQGGIVFHQTNGGATIRGTTFEIDRAETPAIRTFAKDSDHSGMPVFDDLTVEGTADGGPTMMLEGRDGTEIRNCTIEQTGAERNGIYFRNSEECEISNTVIEVTRNPLILRGSTVHIENTTLVTPDSSRYIDEMDAKDEDFTPRGEK